MFYRCVLELLLNLDVDVQDEIILGLGVLEIPGQKHIFKKV
jgi:hypothetical protein